MPVFTVQADNTEDLLNIYGLTLGGPVRTDIDNKIKALELKLRNVQVLQGINDEYNEILRKYIEQRESKIDGILNDVSVYQSKNMEVVSNINSNILDGSIDDLLKYDSQYKTNVSYMNELLDGMNAYQLDYSYRYIDADISDVEAELSETKELYVESLDAYNLGDVKNIAWILPNEKHINSKYGYRVDPIIKGKVRFHAGTDYRGTTGMPIKALFNGVVTSCGWSDTIGNFVTVQSGDNVKYLVCHCSKLNVKQGQEVSQYDTIAYVGGTGSRCTGPHLHLALYLNGVTYDVDKLFEN